MCIGCSQSFYKKCLKLTPKTFNKFHVSKNFLCVDCAFKNLLFYQSSDSSDYYSTGLKSDFSSNDQLNFFNNCNSLEIISNNEEDIFKINSKCFTINIASLNKYLDDLHTLLSIINLQIQVIGICEHKIKRGSCLNGSLPIYTFEFDPATSTHGGVGFSLMTIHATK